MSNSYWGDNTPKPVQSAHDYEHRKITDERYYEVLENQWLQQHRCTFPLEMLASGANLMTEFDPCKKSITFKIPPTKGTDWNHGSFNQRYKDGETPLIETKTFPLWSKLWNQYKIDAYEFSCANTQEYKSMLDDINMKDLSDTLLAQAVRLLGTYETNFCTDCGVSFGSEADPLLIREGESDITSYLFERGDAFQVNCFPAMGWMALFPLCAKSIMLKDTAINELWSECCQNVPPALSGVMPDFIQNVNGVTPVFLKDEFFQRIEVETGVFAYKIPVFHADALAYHPALLDDTMIGADKEEDGNHFRRVFFYFMQVVQENMVANDWIVFERQGLRKYSSTAPAPVAP